MAGDETSAPDARSGADTHRLAQRMQNLRGIRV